MVTRPRQVFDDSDKYEEAGGVCGGSLANWETSKGCEDKVIFVAHMSQHLVL